MNKKTLTALMGSIAKWEGIVAGTEEDLGIANCPLCGKFRLSSWSERVAADLGGGVA